MHRCRLVLVVQAILLAHRYRQRHQVLANLPHDSRHLVVGSALASWALRSPDCAQPGRLEAWRPAH